MIPVPRGQLIELNINVEKDPHYKFLLQAENREINKQKNRIRKNAEIFCDYQQLFLIDDFPEVRKIVDAGATNKPIKDYELSRYACYLIVQNGDPRKEAIIL